MRRPMEAILSASPPDLLLLPSSLLPRRVPSSSLHRPLIPLRSARRMAKLQIPFSCSPSAFNGWEEVEAAGFPLTSDSLRHVLASLGFAARKDVFLFSVGFACALTISRVRLSVMTLVPVSILAFAVGHSVRAFGGGYGVGRVGGVAGRGKDGGGLQEFFDLLDGKVEELKDAVGVGDAARCMEVVEAVRLAAAPAKEAAWANLGGGLVDPFVERRASNQKVVNRRRKGGSFAGFDFLELVAGFLQEVSGSPKGAKLTAWDDGSNSDNSRNDRGSGGRSKDGLSSTVAIGVEMDEVGGVRGEAEMEDARGNPSLGSTTAKDDVPLDMLPFGRHLSSVNDSGPFLHRKKSFQKKMVVDEKSYRSDTNMSSSSLGSSVTSRENENDVWSLEGSSTETMLETHKETIVRSRGMTEKKRTEQKWNPVGDFLKEKSHASSGDVFDGSQFEPVLNSHDEPLLPAALCEEEFSQNLKEAGNLLMQAKDYLKIKDGKEAAEARLYQSAELLSAAVAMKPRSLLAVGQLGNTFLLHGEIKLRISRDLRTLLSGGGSGITKKEINLQFKGLNEQALSREKVASVLIDVCEECEELLVKAGKSYRMALSIDGSDIRALYNWGLALTFRAQLIGDIGPESAFDADKIYLAAIDKFSALTFKSRTIAPNALFRWGLALQQRSQLRPPDSREKMKLLKQAKSLFEDVLCSDSNNPVVREALFSCISELNFYSQLK